MNQPATHLYISFFLSFILTSTFGSLLPNCWPKPLGFPHLFQQCGGSFGLGVFCCRFGLVLWVFLFSPRGEIQTTKSQMPMMFEKKKTSMFDDFFAHKLAKNDFKNPMAKRFHPFESFAAFSYKKHMAKTTDNRSASPERSQDP